MLTSHWPGATGGWEFEYWAERAGRTVYLPPSLSPSLFRLMVHLLQPLSRQYKQFSEGEMAHCDNFIGLSLLPPPSSLLPHLRLVAVLKYSLDQSLAYLMFMFWSLRPTRNKDRILDTGPVGLLQDVLGSHFVCWECLWLRECLVVISVCNLWQMCSGCNLVILHVNWLPGLPLVLYFTTMGIYSQQPLPTAKIKTIRTNIFFPFNVGSSFWPKD